MGHEAYCTAHYRGRVSKGRALLETDALIFRGEFRLAISLKSVQAVEVRNGRLMVTFPDGRASFELGPQAPRWAQRIHSPKRLIDKLGLKPDSCVVVLGVNDKEFWAQLDELGVKASKGRLRANADAIILGANTPGDLARLRSLQSSLTRNGAIWVVAPRGSTEVPERAVLAAGLAAKLVDVKVARFSETHTAHKFVIPISRR